MNKWIKVTDQLPPEIYVLVHLASRPWHDSSDPSGVFYDVAKIKYGISEKQRERLAAAGDDRANIFRSEDEWTNNLRNYCWHTFGPMTYFGQDVDYWMPIPYVPQEVSR